jgi:5'-methylthioadenosine phosphorylase
VAPIDLAVLGGSGFYEMPGLGDVEEVTVDTPYGPPSDAIRVGTLEGARLAFLARHGRGHRLFPSELPQRANFWALKSLGVKRVLAISAVGSLQEELRPGDLVCVDQFIDRTRGTRPATFFGDGVVAHVGMADPVCPALAAVAIAAAQRIAQAMHAGGTYVCIEGPAFGTRAESHLYRSWGAHVVGMTALPEAKLAREAELCYALVAAVTDYDSWHSEHDAVDAKTVFAVLQQNVEKSQALVREMARALPPVTDHCGCQSALDSALVTQPAEISPEARQRLRPLLARVLEARE